MIALNERTRTFDEAAVVNAGGTGGLAAAASEAEIEMTDRVVVEIEAALGERLHQVDSAARGIHLGACDNVGGASLGAEAAMNAVEQQIVVSDVAQ